MGHGDEIVLADAHFPGESLNKNIIRADGLMIRDLLKAILPLIPPDTYVDCPLIMMAAVPDDNLDPEVEKSYRDVIDKYWISHNQINRIERFDFYEKSKSAFAVVMTGETAKYGNIILKKGVITI
jgi:L-fucose mutarotase